MRDSVIDNIHRQHDNNNNNNIADDRVLHMMLDSNINIARNTEESAHDVEGIHLKSTVLSSSGISFVNISDR